MYGLILAGLIMSIVAIESLPRDAYVSPLFCIAGMAATAVAVVLIGLLIDLWIAVRSRSVDPGRLARSSRRLGRLYQILVLAVYGVEIFVLDWPGYVASAVPVTAGSMLLTEALVLAPFLVLVLASWAVFFPSDRRLRAISSRPALSLRHYMTLHTRQHMLIALGPLVVMLAIHDSAAAMFSTAGAGSATGVATVIALGGLILLSGLWIKTCWGAVSMPEGGLRSRLESLARRARLKVRDILLWPTYNTIVNGCVIGPVGTFRYILITDALLDALPAQEIEAVFSHEIGHIKHRHMHLYIFLAFGGLALAEPVMQLAEALTQSQLWTQVAVMGELLFFWLVVFGYVSRRCELEADLYAIQATTCLAGCTPSEAAILGTKESDRAVWADAICLHKAVVFAEALERIARLNGISPQARSWRHFSIARRVRFVIAMAENPDLAWHFERRLKRTKRLLILFAAASISYLALLQFLPE